MVGTYNGWLVVLSVVVAIIASYVALDLASRVSASQGHKAAWYWQTGGAISQGSGIWSMHFVGMLAFRLPIPMSYDVWITLLSLILPILVSGYGLHTVSRGALNARRLVIGGVLIGIGIVSMHYTGMAAMKMQPPIRYEPLLFSLSILIAVAASVVGLWSAFKLRLETILSAFWKKAGSALVMGAGISGMHYTGMAGAIFAPNNISTVSPQNIDDVWLVSAVGGFSLVFLAATLLISAFDAYRAERAAKLTDGLRQAQSELEARVAERTAELARTNQALLEQIAERDAANERIQALSRHLVEAQESQRKELSRELHDRVGQNLTALDINLNILKTQLSGHDFAELRSRLEDSISLVGSTADAIENVMSELRPPMLNDHGLMAALHWYAKEFSQRTGIDAAESGREPKHRLAQEIEITLFRIAQQALNNVAKHARATRVELELQHSGSECILSVSDNGIGFDPAVSSEIMSRPGRGMVTMRERAQAVGGTSRSKRCPVAARKSWFGSLADMTIRVLIADDHCVVAEGLSYLIQAQADMEVIACVEDGREAVRWAMETRPDVVLMDSAMPELNGTAARHIICQRRPETRVIMLSMYADPIHVCRALQAGATGYVAKKAVAKEVVDAIRAVHSGKRYLSSPFVDSVIDHFLSGNALHDPLERLSARERQVLQMLAEGRSVSDIACTLSLSPKTVETYRARMLDKLGLHDLASLIKFAIQQGIVSFE